MYFFRIIIPTTDRSPELLNDAINSIESQTFKDYTIVVPHDGYKQTVNIKEDNVLHVFHTSVDMKGGNIDRAIDASDGNINKGIYTLFLDEGDVLASNTVLEELHNFITRDAYPVYPDLIRLPYKKVYSPGNNGIIKRYRGENTIADIARSSKVAAWTKCINSSVLVQFPYHMVHEDIVQHIIQVDKINTFGIFSNPVVENRLYIDNPNTYPPITDQSSMWRLVAELMELSLTHDYSEDIRADRINFYVNRLAKDYQNDNEIFSKLARELTDPNYGANK